MKRLRLVTILLIVVFVPLFASCSENYVTENDVTQYGKHHFYDVWGGDIDSALLVFPDSISENANVSAFFHRYQTGLFDTSGEIFLQYTLPEEEFNNEVLRIADISVTIYDRTIFNKNNSVTNKIRYDGDSFGFEAYVASDGYCSVFEYALIDRDSFTITCVYISYYDSATTKINAEYLKKDKKEMKDCGLGGFTIYAHSFDNGNSYEEYELGDYLGI